MGVGKSRVARGGGGGNSPLPRSGSTVVFNDSAVMVCARMDCGRGGRTGEQVGAGGLTRWRFDCG